MLESIEHVLQVFLVQENIRKFVQPPSQNLRQHHDAMLSDVFQKLRRQMRQFVKQNAENTSCSNGIQKATTAGVFQRLGTFFDDVVGQKSAHGQKEACLRRCLDCLAKFLRLEVNLDDSVESGELFFTKVCNVFFCWTWNISICCMCCLKTISLNFHRKCFEILKSENNYRYAWKFIFNGK